MKRGLGMVAAVAVMASSGVLATTASAAPSDTASSGPGNSAFGVSHMPVCAAVPAGRVRCHAEVVSSQGRKPAPAPGVSYDATELRAAYGIDAPTGAALPSGPTVAGGDA